MSKIIKTLVALSCALLFLFLIADFPNLLQLNQSKQLFLNWSLSVSSLKDYFTGIASGDSFRFLSGKTEHSFWEQVGSYFKVSLFYITVGALIGTTIGVLAGIYFGLSRAEWLKRIVELLGAVPDFVMILLLQFLVVYVASKTGVVIFQVATVTSQEPAIVLPLISAIIIPANYMIRNVALQMKLTMSQDYIGFAKARGLRKPYITFYHALPNVLPFIKADLPKFLGILMGNIFIIEYLYNLHGVTQLLFSNAYAYNGYQFALVVNGLFTFILLYAIAYALVKAYLWGWEKVFAR